MCASTTGSSTPTTTTTSRSISSSATSHPSSGSARSACTTTATATASSPSTASRSASSVDPASSHASDPGACARRSAASCPPDDDEDVDDSLRGRAGRAHRAHGSPGHRSHDDLPEHRRHHREPPPPRPRAARGTRRRVQPLARRRVDASTTSTGSSPPRSSRSPTSTLAVQQLEFALAHGARLVQLMPGPAVWGRSPADPLYDPFWARVNEAGTIVTFHLGNSGYQERYSPDWGEYPDPDGLDGPAPGPLRVPVDDVLPGPADHGDALQHPLQQPVRPLPEREGRERRERLDLGPVPAARDGQHEGHGPPGPVAGRLRPRPSERDLQAPRVRVAAPLRRRHRRAHRPARRRARCCSAPTSRTPKACPTWRTTRNAPPSSSRASGIPTTRSG